MILTAINKNGVYSISLPEKVAGQYWLYDRGNHGAERLASVEGMNGQWVLKSNKNLSILDNSGNYLKNIVIQPLCIYPLLKNNTERTYVFTEPLTDDRQIFVKYMVKNDTSMVIGRSEQSHIYYNSPMVSANHAVLSLQAGKWYLNDSNSANGTFVNEKRIHQTPLNIGDLIYIMGLKIVVGKNFIAVNNPDGRVKISYQLSYLVPQTVVPPEEEEEEELQEPNYFYRSPRFKRDIEKAEFKMDSPPTSPLSEEMPWLLVMGSSMAMGMMSAVTLFSAIAAMNITSMVMGGSMLIGTLLMPMITKKYERNRNQKKEALRQKKYRAYLDKMTIKIDEVCQLQEEILNENHITVQECQNRIMNTQRNLWERAFGQNDFLKIRLGNGDGILDAEFLYQERKFSLDDDNLEEELLDICEKQKTLHNVPITYSIYDNYISGIIGAKEQTLDFVKGIIIQLAALYSYDEVKFVFLIDPEELEKISFIKWLPHVWSDDNQFRFLATNNAEGKEISAYFDNIVTGRSEWNDTEMADILPYYIIFSFSRNLSIHMEVLKKIYSAKKNLHISVISVGEELKDFPKECSMIVELNHNDGKLYDKNDMTGKSISFKPDIFVSNNPLYLGVKLANIKLNILDADSKLPEMMTFLEMFGVGKVEHLNSLTRWKENDPTKSLETAVGVDALGDLFKLDLHEKFHGPHGLVAGMTGSGKSEFIMTYILSLAVNYHPNEVAFILIDYKGGGMAKSFENLPHVAGIITNLDGAAIKRSLISIESELHRRETIFARVSKQVGVSNIDIYKYQRLYREGIVSEPLQHLFIISDEFAELKTQQPGFMTQLISAARIGRSLGVHLILATQKPSGVVDDQIWSNSKFRVCLKVQERADSMDMLKRSDAAELTHTGRFYLQVGYNELFELGQSAWAGAPYYPSDRVQKEKDNSVVVIDRNGHPLKEAKIDTRKQLFSDAKKQLDEVTEYLRKIAEDEHIKIRALWLEPIPAVILLDELKKKYAYHTDRFVLNPIIGEYDDPAHQRQCLMRLPISEEGNVMIYGTAGSGKTSFLNVMIYSLIHEHTPDELNLYILDFSAETLTAFAKAPHVGDVLLSSDGEKVSNLLKMLRQEFLKRKKLFADYGGDYQSYIRISGNPLPAIVVVIHNFPAFTEMFEGKEEAVSYLSREGTKYGIYFVLTALGAGSVRYRLLQNFKQSIVLQLNDESDYSGIIGKTDGLFPSKYKGRGLVKKEALYEFQTSYITSEKSPFRWIQKECRNLSENWHGSVACKIPILPENVNIDFLGEYLDKEQKWNIPVGVEKNTLRVHYYPFGGHYINMILSKTDDCYELTDSLISMLSGYGNYHGVFFDLSGSSAENRHGFHVVSRAQDCESAVSQLYDLVLYRNNTYKDALSKNTVCEKFDDILVVINSFVSLRDVLDNISREKLSLALEKGNLNYHILFIISEQAKNISSFAFEKWYKTHVSGSDGLWIGDGITEQYYLKATKTTSEMHEDISSEFGYSLIDGRSIRLKLLNEKAEEEYDGS